MLPSLKTGPVRLRVRYICHGDDMPICKGRSGCCFLLLFPIAHVLVSNAGSRFATWYFPYGPMGRSPSVIAYADPRYLPTLSSLRDHLPSWARQATSTSQSGQTTPSRPKGPVPKAAFGILLRGRWNLFFQLLPIGKGYNCVVYILTRNLDANSSTNLNHTQLQLLQKHY